MSYQIAWFLQFIKLVNDGSVGIWVLLAKAKLFVKLKPGCPPRFDRRMDETEEVFRMLQDDLKQLKTLRDDRDEIDASLL